MALTQEEAELVQTKYLSRMPSQHPPEEVPDNVDYTPSILALDAAITTAAPAFVAAIPATINTTTNAKQKARMVYVVTQMIASDGAGVALSDEEIRHAALQYLGYYRRRDATIVDTLADWEAGFVATEGWFGDHAAAFNTAIEQPLRSLLTTPQKAHLFAEILRLRFRLAS